ncbi:MAG TPA: amidase family protein, partial [Puia sp.]|nr:amidase family protein [Puia sp.]
MDRRKFLRNGSMAGVAFSALNFGVWDETAAAAVAEGGPAGKGFALEEATIEELQAKMGRGELSSEQMVKMYLKRIAEMDKKGPALNAVLEVNPDAVSIAAAMDAERKAGKVRGPMHGIPVLIKDNIDSGDKMQTTAGALALEGHRAAKDAFIIQQLRASGAVLLGKTNLSEWANFRSTRSTSGWSSRGGQTKMPYLLNRNP